MGEKIIINVWMVFLLQPGEIAANPKGNPGSFAAVWIPIIYIGTAKVKNVDTITCKFECVWLMNYSRVHISSDSLFSKILQKPSIV